MSATLLRRAALPVIAIAILSGLIAGAAAYWHGTGGGLVTTSIAGSQPLGFEPGAPSAQLLPGGSATVSIVARNANPESAQIGSLVLGPGEAFGVDAAHAACDLSALGFVAQDNGGAGWRVPPRSGGVDGSLTIAMPAAMTMSAAATNACQGAEFTVQLEAKR